MCRCLYSREFRKKLVSKNSWPVLPKYAGLEIKYWSILFCEDGPHGAAVATAADALQVETVHVQVQLMTAAHAVWSTQPTVAVVANANDRAGVFVVAVSGKRYE